jgi:DNA invertase Pin-like site-specific DNA recombinase
MTQPQRSRKDTPPTALKAVAYYRMSTAKQDQSIPEQRRAVHALAAKEGYEIIREYDGDAAISGDATEKRKDFQRMSRDAQEKRDFQIVLCWDQDRFGRFDSLDAGYWIKPFRDAGVRLETVAQGKIDWESFAGRLCYTVQQGAKHEFIMDLSRNALRGLRDAALRGQWVGGVAPYAYKVATIGKEGRKLIKKLAPGEPLQIEVVRWLYKTYADKDVSLWVLANELHCRNVLSPRGKALWSSRTVHKLLTNRVYVGDFVWNQEHRGSYHALVRGEIQPQNKRVDKPRPTPPEEWIIVENTHPPLIDRELFERVQAKLASRQTRTTPTAGGGDWLLSGLLVCGHCGYRMQGSTQTMAKRPGWSQRRYRCNAYMLYGKAACHCHALLEAALVRCVLGKVQEALLNPATLEKLREELKRQAEAPWQQDLGAARQLREQIADLGKQIDQGTGRLATIDADLVPLLGTKLREWRDERIRLEAALLAAERPPDCADLKDQIAKAEKLVWEFKEVFEDADPLRLRTLLHQIIDRIELRWECGPDGNRRRCHFQAGIIYAKAETRMGLVTSANSSKRTAKEASGISTVGQPYTP